MQKIKWPVGFAVLSLLLLQCKTSTYAEGQRIYSAYCSNCHMDDGSGLAALIPPLTDTQYLRDHTELLPCIILHGMEGPITVAGTNYNQQMPGAKLTDVQVLNLINFLGNEWGNDLGYQTITDIKSWIAECDSK